MTAVRPHLRVVKASGEPQVRQFVVDGQVQTHRRLTPCYGCDLLPARGQEITHYRGTWWHLDCARRDLAGKPTSQAWIALAEQLVKRPSGFKPREVKVITQALLEIVEPGWPARAVGGESA